MNKIKELVAQLESKKEDFEAWNKDVSQATVGWHLAHSLLVLNSVVGAMEKTDPKDYVWHFNWSRTLVLLFKKIPRGKKKAPERVVPKERVTKEMLETYFATTKIQLTVLENLDDKHYFKHPSLGMMKREKTISFLEVHTQHHLDIVLDILTMKL